MKLTHLLLKQIHILSPGRFIRHIRLYKRKNTCKHYQSNSRFHASTSTNILNFCQQFHLRDQQAFQCNSYKWYNTSKYLHKFCVWQGYWGNNSERSSDLLIMWYPVILTSNPLLSLVIRILTVYTQQIITVLLENIKKKPGVPSASALLWSWVWQISKECSSVILKCSFKVDSLQDSRRILVHI